MEAQEIVQKILDGKKKNIQVRPQYVTRASEVGFPCERYLVYSITNWRDRQPHSAETELIFEGGRVIEDLAIQDLTDAGFKVYRPEPDKACAEAKPALSGHIDVRVDFGDGKVYTGEIKGLNHIDFCKINSIYDMQHSRKPWLRKYPPQLMTYLYIKGEERGFFMLVDKLTFMPKFIWVDLDLPYMDEILQKTERVEAHIKNKTLPEQIDDPEICEKCAFAHICLPQINRAELEIIIDPALEEMLARRDELKDAASEYTEVDKAVKAKFGEREKLCIGEYVAIGKWIEKKEFTVKAQRYMMYKIQKVSG